MTAAPGQRFRRHRDLVLFSVYGPPFSQRTLADVFDLSRRRVRDILDRLSAESGLPLDSLSAADRTAWAAAALCCAAHGLSQTG